MKIGEIKRNNLKAKPTLIGVENDPVSQWNSGIIF